MAMHPILVQLPDPLYRHVEQRAAATQRSIEETLTEFIATAIPQVLELPEALAEAIAHLDLLDDQSLWRAARKRLSSRLVAQLEQLHQKQQREGLNAFESQERQQLMHQYEQTMLIRAEAARILAERGHDVQNLLSKIA